MYSKLIEFIKKSLYYLFVLLFALIILMIGIVSMAIYNFFQPYDHSDFVKVTKELKKVEEILLNHIMILVTAEHIR